MVVGRWGARGAEGVEGCKSQGGRVRLQSCRLFLRILLIGVRKWRSPVWRRLVLEEGRTGCPEDGRARS